MRAIEFVTEEVSRAETTEHLINRLNKAAELCDNMADVPLLVREFKTGINRETVLAKVINKTEKEGSRRPASVKGGVGKEGQTAILEKLGIENPVFTKMDLPNDTFGFHGDPHIFIPPPESAAYWSPLVVDLGGQRVVKKLHGDEQDTKNKDGSITIGWMAKEADKWADTYQKNMPSEYMRNEIIWDCEYYYLLNIQSFLNKFSGKENKYSMHTGAVGSKKIDPEVWASRIRTYADVAKHIRKYGIPYVEWYRDNVENKSPGERQSYMSSKPSKPTYEVKSKTGQTVRVSADDEREAIYQALNTRGATSQYGPFPQGRDSIESVTKK